jgi:hypothetical protein
MAATLFLVTHPMILPPQVVVAVVVHQATSQEMDFLAVLVVVGGFFSVTVPVEVVTHLARLHHKETMEETVLKGQDWPVVVVVVLVLLVSMPLIQ